MKTKLTYFSTLIKQIQDGEVGLVASSLAFSTALAFIPFLAVSLAALQNFGGVEALYPKIEAFVLNNFSDSIGPEGMNLMKLSIKRVSSGKLGTLGTIFLLIISTRLIYILERAVNRVWNLKNNRAIIKRLFAYWFVMMLIPVSIAGSFMIFTTQKNISPGAIKAVLYFFPLFLLNCYVPATKVKKLYALAGSMLTTITIIIAQSFFLGVNNRVFNYSKLYGSLASVPLFLIWILTMWYIVMIGVAVTASFQRKEAHEQIF